MKRSIVTLAALCACGAASAQVTVFGAVDLAYTRINASNVDFTGLVSGNNVGSHFGFRGVEDLGGGYGVSFWLEAGINAATGAGVNTNTNNQVTGISSSGLAFNRRATISLTGPFGELRLGRDYTPTFMNDFMFDPFRASTGIGSSMPIQTQAFMVNNGFTYPRASNTISYFTPNTLGGWYGQAMVALGENPGPARKNDGDYTGMRLGYRSGPLDVSFATGVTRQTASPAAAPVPALSGDYKSTSIGASYDFGVVRLMGSLIQTDVESFGGVPGADQDGTGWVLGAVAPVGPGQLMASLSGVKLKVNGAAISAPTKAVFGYAHHLSKRTAVYANYAQIRNDSGSAFTPGLFVYAPGATAPNSTTRAIEIGIRHVF